MSKRTCLIIMDGWGVGVKDPAVNAIEAAQTPFVDSLYQTCPHAQLFTHGTYVGLPDGQMGNSEVGHMNIGAGRVVYQELLKITKALEAGVLAEKESWKQIVQYTKENLKPLHLLGLLSDGGVHSHIEHLKGIIKQAVKDEIPEVFIHAFMDGRDTDPHNGINYMKALEKFIEPYSHVNLVTVVGRYYAMDRDLRWERIKIAYDALKGSYCLQSENLISAVNESYKNGVTDEFLKPVVLKQKDGTLAGRIQSDDAVFVFNFRTDRCRQLTTALFRENLLDFDMQKIPLHFTTMTRYDKTFEDVNVMFENETVELTIGEVLEKQGKTQLRAAETEKYPHVTFFFNGGREKPFDGEKRLLIQSPKVATYDLQPEMSANELTDTVIREVESSLPDFICLNFANPDMVGHTGDFNAAVKAVETVDRCVERVVQTLKKAGYTVFLTADHGNADFMLNPDKSPNTAHSTNPVPLFLINSQQGKAKLSDGKLGDLAPTILNHMGIEPPALMTGKNLLMNGGLPHV